MGKIEALCVSPQRGTEKNIVSSAEFKPDWGIINDAHAGNWHRQVSLLSLEKIEAFRRKGVQVAYGAFGENIVVSGFDLAKLPVGTLLRSGKVLLEVSQIGKECHSHCAIYQRVGDCIMPREGIFAKVLEGGLIRAGDPLEQVERVGIRPYQAAVITLSDKASKGERPDASGPVLVKGLGEAGYAVVEALILPDEGSQLQAQLIRLADQRQLDLIITTGGTGFAKRDVTPEATLAIADKNVPGIAEAIRAMSMQITPRAMLSRAVSVIRGKTLIVNFPGSPKACTECLAFLLPTLPHGLDLLRDVVSECARLSNSHK